MVTIITGTTKKPTSSELLKKFFHSHHELDGYLYIGYPIIGTVDGAYPIDGLWISPAKGLVIFNLIEGKNTEGYEEAQDDCANKIEAKLKGYRQLVNKRKLCVEINVITYAPALMHNLEYDEDYPLCISDNDLQKQIETLKWENSGYYEQLVSVLQAISTIRKGKKRREATKPDSRGSKLKAIEDQISCLDKYQSKAVIETVEGVQRIRGLAGSGKTIVLALKVAYLYTMYENKMIAVTFNSRALKGQFIQLITNFIVENTNEEPDWSRIKIIHAWGSKNSEGLYFNFCKANNLVCYDYMDACQKYGRNSSAFDRVCEEAVESVTNPQPLYDVILVDEAQDFSKYFLQMCYMSLPHESRMLVYAYDELQSLDNKNVESPEDIFGYSNGRPNVVLDNSNGKAEDIVLSKCYRNSRPVLITAHSLGFGIYRKKEAREETSLVQLFEDKQLWEDIGYTVKEGVIRDGEFVTLYRTEETSPAFLEDHSSIDDLIQFRRFENNVQEADWIVEDIEKNLHDEELRYQDIMIIHPDPKITKSYVSHIRVKLMEKGIKSHIVGVQTTPDDFFQEDSIAISQIYRAKGNEAAVVYLINADLCARGINLSRKRNIIFTAMTRSKAWVRVSGIGDDMDLLIQEFNSVKERNFQLEFTYPDKSQRKNMRIIHRDMTQNELRDIRKSNSNLADITSKLANGEIRKEDLDEDTVNRLKDVLYN